MRLNLDGVAKQRVSVGSLSANPDSVISRSVSHRPWPISFLPHIDLINVLSVLREPELSHSYCYCYCTKVLTELSDISRKWAGLPRGRISANYLLLVFTFTHCLWPGFLERRCILGAFANWESVSGPSIRHQPWPQYGHHTQCHHTGSKQEIPCPSPSAVNTNVFQSIRVWSKKVYFFLLLSESFFVLCANSRCN